jgi:hypothetical protein
VEPEGAAVLREQRRRLLVEQAPGLAEGWMFPTNVGTLRAPSSVDKALKKALVTAKIDRRFTLHGLRYTFTDLVRRANVDAVVRRALTGHVTEEMQRHYSTVGMDEKRAAVAGVIRLVPTASTPAVGPASSAPAASWPKEPAANRATRTATTPIAADMTATTSISTANDAFSAAGGGSGGGREGPIG